MSSVLNAALRYATVKSWPVFPVNAAKTPLTTRGFKEASRDEHMIREWWRRYPEAGVALAIPEGVLVVDVDPRNGGVLPAGLPPTLSSSTRNGGSHHFYLVPVDVHFVGKAAQGVDLKAGGKGYVILPPTDGYAWSNYRPPAYLPSDFIQAWSRVPFAKAVKSDETVVRYLPWEQGTNYGLAALRNQVEHLQQAENGERNHTLFKAAAGLYSLAAGGEVREDEVSERLLETALEIGLDEVETVRTLQSARDRGFEDPRSAHA